MEQDFCNDHTGQTKDGDKETAAIGKQSEVCTSAVLMHPSKCNKYLGPALTGPTNFYKDQNTG